MIISETSAANEKPSLVVLSLPRSLSGLVYHFSLIASDLNEPKWTSDGEILNIDRFVFFGGPINDFGKKFIHNKLNHDQFYRAADFLNHVIKPKGFAYKDVVQPFIFSNWLPKDDYNIIRIKRNVVDVAYSMLRMQWFYPSKLFSEVKDRTLALVGGLILADKALDSVKSTVIDFELLIEDESHLRNVVNSFYPKSDFVQLNYFDEAFCRRKEEIKASRKTDVYKALFDYSLEASKMSI